MMKMQHLTNEDAKLLGEYKLAGSALFEVLEHIENCEVCRLKVPVVASETIINRLSATELPARKNVVLANTQKSFQFGWNLRIGFAAFLLGISFGFYYFISDKDGHDLASDNTDFNKSGNINNVNVSEQTSNSTLKKESTEIVNKKSLDKEFTPSNTNSNLKPDFAKNKSPEKNRPKSVPMTNQQKIAEPATASNKKNFDENNELHKFLLRIPATILSLRPNFGNVRSLNSENETIKGLSPNGEVIKETQPILSWKHAKNVGTYQISVTDKSYKSEVNEKSTTNTLKVKSHLKRGQTYIFTVTAEKENNEDSIQEPNHPAIFRVASQKALAKLARAEKSGKDWSILSVMLKEGMLGEAEKKLNHILIKKPKDTLAMKLLARVKNLRSINENSP